MFRKAAKTSFQNTKKANQASHISHNPYTNTFSGRLRSELQCYEIFNKLLPPLNYIKDYKKYRGFDEDANLSQVLFTNIGRDRGSKNTSTSKKEAKSARKSELAMSEFHKNRSHSNVSDIVTRTPEEYQKLFDKLRYRDYKKAYALMREKRDDDEAVYLEKENRGFIKKEFTRSLHILSYADVKEIYGDMANTDPFRHTYFDVMEVNSGNAYRMRTTDRVRRRMEDFGRNSYRTFVNVKG